MADEGARVCLDAGAVDSAERWYRHGYQLGSREPTPRTHPQALWDYRLAHALGRIAARRGDAAEAERQITTARRLLDGDSAWRPSRSGSSRTSSATWPCTPTTCRRPSGSCGAR